MEQLVCWRCADLHGAVNCTFAGFPLIGTAAGLGAWLCCIGPILALVNAPPWLVVPGFLFSVVGGTLLAITIVQRRP
jgi:hypothetical protein